MFCARCGEQIADGSEICPLCGREANLRIDPPAPIPALAQSQLVLPGLPKVSGPCGIGGWLQFFCVVLTVLGPASVLVQASSQTRFYNPYYIIAYARVFYGAVVGIVLWMRRPVALALLKIYFIVVASTILLAALQIVAVALRTRLSIFLVPWFAPALQLGYTILWFAYFKRSVRVRNTYGANL